MKMDPEALKEVKDAYQKVAEANRELHHEWLYHVVFTWRWWLALLLTVGIWGLWFWLRKKESTDRLLYAGFFVIFLSSWLDFIGVVNGYWRYTVDVFHTIPAFIVFDFSLIPVSVMLYLQFFPRLSPWIKGVLFAGGASFIGEPLFQWLDIYEPEKWARDLFISHLFGNLSDGARTGLQECISTAQTGKERPRGLYFPS